MSDRQTRLFIIVLVGAAVAVAVVGFAFTGGGGDDLTVSDNPAIEEISPTRGAEVLQQEPITVDLAPGYEGTIERLNDIVIPPAEVSFDPTRNIVTFDPAEGKVIETLLPDQNCVTARYWLIAEGPTLASTFTWCFTAA